MPLSPAASWRSPLLGESRSLNTSQGPLVCHSAGSGRPLVFVHGWLANANLWRNVVAGLSDRFRCIAFDMPFGSHTVHLGTSADLTPQGCGRLILEALDLLDLHDAVLIGNDSGGAYSQIAAAFDAKRLGGLVLTTGETPYDTFPPAAFRPLKQAAQAGALRTVLSPLRDHSIRMSDRAFGKLVKHPVEANVFDSFCLPILEDDGILADAQKAWGSATEVPVAEAGRKLTASFKHPVLFAWAPEDAFFPLDNAKRFAAELHNARVELVPDSFSFTPQDQPERLASLIASIAAVPVAA